MKELGKETKIKILIQKPMRAIPDPPRQNKSVPLLVVGCYGTNRPQYDRITKSRK